MENASATPLVSHGTTRISAPVRLWYLFAMGVLVSLPYFWLGRHPAFPVTQVPLSMVDRATPFVSFAGWLYILLYPQLALPLLLVRDTERLRRMVFGFAWITILSHLLFFFWPTAVPAFSLPVTNFPLRLVSAADTSANALPSLHASLAMYCALCAASLLKGRTSRISLWVLTCLILASTLLARRHVFLDIVAGGALGVFAYWALFCPRPEESTHCEAWQATLQARKSLSQGLEAELAPLLAFRWRKRALEFVSFFALAVIGIWLSLSSRWLPMTCGIFLTSLALNAFVLLMHDGMHFTLVRNRQWNWLLSVLLGSTFLMSFTAYRVLHSRHHKYLGDSRDPDDYQNYLRWRPLLWFLHFVRLTVGALLYLVLIPILALKYANDHERETILGEYAFLLIVYSALLRFVPGHLILSAYFVPLLIVGSLTAVRGFTQHGITDASDPLLASRTVLPTRIIGFFLLHENYHLEHHLFPEVPSYHLPRLHALIWQRLPRAVSSRGYLSFLGKFLRAALRMDETPIGLEHPSKESA